MNITPALAAWLASLREWASDPNAVCHTVQGVRGPIPIYPNDVTSRSDAELLAFIRARCAE